jgi:hypothetical protein
MCERLKQAVLKTAVRETVPGVRIPLPPPSSLSCRETLIYWCGKPGSWPGFAIFASEKMNPYSVAAVRTPFFSAAYLGSAVCKYIPGECFSIASRTQHESWFDFRLRARLRLIKVEIGSLLPGAPAIRNRPFNALNAVMKGVDL